MVSEAQKQATVLIIDDSIVVLEVTREALEQAGYRVITQNRATGCVALILQEKPDLVLMDVNMPTLQGDTIVSILRSAEPTSDTVVLLHSSLEADDLEEKAKRAGAHGYIKKTNNALSLVRQVNIWLRRGQSSLGQLRAARALLPSSGKLLVSRPVLVSGLDAAGPSRAPNAASTWNGLSTQVNRPPPDLPTSGTMTIHPGTVLLIDHDMLTLSSHRRLLQSDAISIEFALSGRQGLRRILSSEPPNAVMCGLPLPDLPGLEIYERALAQEAGWRDRFVFVVGERPDPSTEEGLTRFSGSVLRKPVDEHALRMAVRRCIARGKLQMSGTY